MTRRRIRFPGLHRADGTSHTQPTLRSRKTKNRAAAKRAKSSRKVNR